MLQLNHYTNQHLEWIERPKTDGPLLISIRFGSMLIRITIICLHKACATAQSLHQKDTERIADVDRWQNYQENKRLNSKMICNYVVYFNIGLMYTTT